MRFRDDLPDADCRGFCFHMTRPVHRTNEDRNIGKGAQDLPGGAHAIHDWHGQIKDDDIGMEFEGFGDCLLPVFRLDEFHGLGPCEELSKRGSNTRVVVSNEYSM